MSLPTTVNGKVTDSVTQESVALAGSACSLALATVYQTMAHSINVLIQNSTVTQQMNSTSAYAATNQGTVQIYSVPSLISALSESRISQGDVASSLLTFLTAVEVDKDKVR